MSYDNTNKGALFKNDKGGNEKRPDYRGDLNVDGVEYRLSAWIKKSKGGMNYMSLSVEQKDGQSKKSPPVQIPVEDFVDDDLPPF
jgi:hypothetical protein